MYSDTSPFDLYSSSGSRPDRAYGSSMNITDSSITASSALDWAHPIVREWFLGRLGHPTEPQEQGWPHILAGETTLISAPTGSGKTLAAFLVCIDRLVKSALSGELRDETKVVYVSPLKALGNDIQKNLDRNHAIPSTLGCQNRLPTISTFRVSTWGAGTMLLASTPLRVRPHFANG